MFPDVCIHVSCQTRILRRYFTPPVSSLNYTPRSRVSQSQWSSIPSRRICKGFRLFAKILPLSFLILNFLKLWVGFLYASWLFPYFLKAVRIQLYFLECLHLSNGKWILKLVKASLFLRTKEEFWLFKTRY